MINRNLFVWEGGSGAADLSELGIHAEKVTNFDELELVSPGSGVVDVFYFTETETDPRGNIETWIYQNEIGDVLFVFND